MSPTPAPQYSNYAIAQGLVFCAETVYASVGAGLFAYTGITTGPQEVVILQRMHSSSAPILTVELFEASHTAGTPARPFNRRLSVTEQPPATVFLGVTPGALTDPITSIKPRAITSTGTLSVQISGGESRIYLKANTSYVVRYTNGGAGSAEIISSFDFRKVLKGAWERAIESL